MLCKPSSEGWAPGSLPVPTRVLRSAFCSNRGEGASICGFNFYLTEWNKWKLLCYFGRKQWPDLAE